MLPELSKIIDKAYETLSIHAVDPRNEPDVLGTGQIAVKRSAKTDWPGNRSVGNDLPAIRPDRSCYHLQERRLARTVAA